MKQFQAQIVYNRQISAGFFEASLSWDVAAGAPGPGQFLTVRVSPDTVPLLRRPFAFAGYDAAAQTVSIIYQKRGKGTEILSTKQAGEKIDVMGPLGTSFPVDGDAEKTIAAAGGIGLGPILFLSAHLKSRGVPTEFVFGCRGETFIPNAASFQSAGARICTDDGSAGFKGNAVQYIESNFKPDGKTVIYACGPVPMLKSLCALAASSGARVWASLESVMACGVGACVGCAVPAASGYPRVCKDGPVFDGKDILWEQI